MASLLTHSVHASDRVNRLLGMVDLMNEVEELSDEDLIETIQRGYMDEIDMTGPLFCLLDELCERLKKRDAGPEEMSNDEAAARAGIDATEWGDG